MAKGKLGKNFRIKYNKMLKGYSVIHNIAPICRFFRHFNTNEAIALL